MATTFAPRTLTVREVMQATYFDKKTRFEYMDRDLLKSKLKIEKIWTFTQDRKRLPYQKYRVTSWSAPQYGNYVKHTKRVRQLKYKHTYDITIEFDKQMSLDSMFKWRCGSMRKWPTVRPKDQELQTISAEYRHRLKLKYPKVQDFKKAVESHRKRAKYLDYSDWISRKYGIMGDFYWRIQPVAYITGNLYGRYWEDDLPEKPVVFFDKHTLYLVLTLIKSGRLIT